MMMGPTRKLETHGYESDGDKDKGNHERKWRINIEKYLQLFKIQNNPHLRIIWELSFLHPKMKNILMGVQKKQNYCCDFKNTIFALNLIIKMFSSMHFILWVIQSMSPLFSQQI
jgi:hypothetical protein